MSTSRSHPKVPTRRPHPLLRGGRWSLARPRSRALWTSATPSEVADLFTNVDVREQLEEFLRLASSAIDDIDAVLVFDQACAHLAVVVSVGDDPGQRCRWDWIADSLSP